MLPLHFRSINRALVAATLAFTTAFGAQAQSEQDLGQEIHSLPLVVSPAGGKTSGEPGAEPDVPPRAIPWINNIVPGGPPPSTFPVTEFPDCTAGCIDQDGKLVPIQGNAPAMQPTR